MRASTAFVLLLPLLVVLLPAQEPAQELSTLTLQVTWAGELPKVTPLEIPPPWKERHPEDAAHCEKCIKAGSLRNEELLVDPEKRGIANVAATMLKQGAATILPDPVLDNRDGRFLPRVQFLPRGSTLKVTNSDPFAHNARITGRGGSPLWNGILPPDGKATTVPFPSPGLYTVFCDMHPWMKSYVIVTPGGRTGISETSGAIVLKDLTPGPGQTVDLWHETLGRARIVVDLKGGQETRQALTQADFRK